MWRKLPFSLKVAPGALLVPTLFVLLFSPMVLLALLMAAVVHEVGHILAIRLLRGSVKGIHATAFGAVIQYEGRFSYGGEVLCAAAGPVANLVLAVLLGQLGRQWETLYLFAGTQLVLGVYNLIPIPPLDGSRMLWNVAAYLTEPYTADRFCGAVGIFCAALLALCAAAAVYCGGSPFFLLAALGLLRGVAGEIGLAKGEKKRYNTA